MLINTCPYLCDPLGNTARIILEFTNDVRGPM